MCLLRGRVKISFVYLLLCTGKGIGTSMVVKVVWVGEE